MISLKLMVLLAAGCLWHSKDNRNTTSHSLVNHKNSQPKHIISIREEEQNIELKESIAANIPSPLGRTWMTCGDKCWAINNLIKLIVEGDGDKDVIIPPNIIYALFLININDIDNFDSIPQILVIRLSKHK